MSGWRRRSVLAAGAAISTGTVITTTESGVAETDGGSGSSIEEPAGWSSYRGTAGNTAYVPSEGSFPEPEAVAWEYDESGRAAIVDGTVYLRTGGAVHALDDTDGSVLWESEEIGADGTPAVVGDSVVVGGAELSALDADTGEVRWSETFDDAASDHEPAVTSPTVADGTVYVVAEESLFAFDLADGSVRWSRETVELEEDANEAEAEQRTETASFGSAPVAVANGLVYAVADEPGFAAFDADDGQTAWTHWRDGYRGLSFSGIAATDERVYVTGSPEDDFPIVDAATGERLDAVPNVFTPAGTAEARVAASPDALRVRDYERDEHWEQVGGTAGWRNPSIVGETIVVPYYPGYDERAVYGLDLADGSERWEFTHSVVDGGGPSQWYAITGDTIYTTGENGLVAIRQEEGEEAEGTDEEDDANDEDEGGESDGEDDESDGGDQHDDDEQESGETDGDDQESDEAGNDETGGDADGEPADEDESDGSESNGTDEYEPAEDDGNVTDDSANGEADDAADDDVTDTDADGNETDDSDAGGDDGTTGTNDADERTDGTSDDTDSEDDNAEGTPGFTAGAGIAGGALGLEWLRRRADPEERQD
jgi:outer membrane protein assembly factor BamB